MGAGEKKPKFFSSIWMTIILVVALVILAIILIWVLKTGWIYKIGKTKKEAKPELKPVMNQQFHHPSERPRLELADDGLITVTESKLS